METPSRLLIDEARRSAPLSAPLHLTYDDIAERIMTRFAVQRSERRASVRLHTHTYFELAYITEGHATHNYGPDTYPVQPHDLLVVGPTVPHGYTVPAAQTLKIINVNFGVDALGDTLRDPAVMSVITLIAMTNLQSGDLPGLFRPAPLLARTLIEQMERESLEKRPGLTTVLKSLLRLTLVELYRRRSHPIDDQEHHPEMVSIINTLPVIYEMATSPEVSVAVIADAAAHSPGYFGRKFKKLMGETVNQYIQRIRVARAIQLLSTTDWPIDEIAAQVGYQDPSAFRMVFRRIAGIPPSDYRRN